MISKRTWYETAEQKYKHENLVLLTPDVVSALDPIGTKGLDHLIRYEKHMRSESR